MTKGPDASRHLLRTLLEMSFIIFLFYANLLMGQYNLGHHFSDRPILEALRTVFTLDNFIIALIAAFIGHVAFDYFRRRL